MGGGLLQLVAYGAQDAYITGNPHITFWKVLYKRHTNFAIEAMRVNFTGAPAYGQRLVAVVNRNADLVWKTYVEVSLPDMTSPDVDPVWTSGAQRRIGYLLLKKIEVEIGGQIIDTHYGEWLYLWETLTADYDTSVKLDSMVGGSLGGTSTAALACRGRPNVLYVPLQFWFNRNPGLALPLIALQYHEVRFNITLGDSTDLVASTNFSNLNGAASALPAPRDMALYLDYIYLDVDERRRFAQESHEYLIDQIQYTGQQTITTSSARIDLTLNHPVKELVWVFQDARKTDCGSDLTISTGYTQPFSYNDIVNRCRIQLNGQDRFDERFGDYFWKVQPYQHHTGGAFWPTKNAQSLANALSVSGTPAPLSIPTTTFTLAGATSATQTYSSLSGSSLFVGMKVNGAGITAGTPRTIVNVFASTATAGTIVFDASFTSTATSYTATVGANSSTGIAADTTITSTGTLTTLAQTFEAANPINVYSFAISPEEHQPSGTCNFSRIDNATLVFDSVASGVAGTFPSKNYPYNFRIYAVNYNIFRIMSGMGGLAYSN
jgi:hypothetical protein